MTPNIDDLVKVAPIPRVALRPRESAKSIGVSQGTFDGWIRNGLLPHIRRGAIVLVPMSKLKKFLAKEADRQAADRIVKKEGGDV